MQKVYEFLKNHIVHVATVDEKGNPQTRPFGAVCIYDGKLCITTGAHKNVCKQLLSNHRLAISAMADDMNWFRFDGEAIAFAGDENNKAKSQMLLEEPNLQVIYDNTPAVQLFYLKGEAKFCGIMGDVTEMFLI